MNNPGLDAIPKKLIACKKHVLVDAYPCHLIKEHLERGGHW